MSWFPSWLTFPAPHDARNHPSSANSQSGTSRIKDKRLLEESGPTPSNDTISPLDARQQNRNKIIVGAGLGFLAFSLLITKRSFTRRQIASKAQFYTDAPGHHVEQSAKTNGAMEALEALNIATINVLSLAMIGVGGSMWYYDINSMADARKLLRGGLGVDGTGRSEKEAEEDFEEWIASTLARKEVKDANKARPRD